MVKDLGWRAVMTKASDKEEKNDDDLPDQTLTRQQKGAEKKVKSCKSTKLKTKPPARYSEATLLTAMESPGKFIEDEELRESIKQGGLGTPATRAEIIEKLLRNFYVERQGKELVPTSKGIQLIELAPESLKTPELTAQWEMRLSNIAKGRESKDAFIQDIRTDASQLVHTVANDTGVFRNDNITKHKCPMCGKFMLRVKDKRGKMLVCSDRTCGFKQMEEGEKGGFNKPKEAGRMNRRLISQYSDSSELGTNLGDLLKAKLAEGEQNKK